MLLIYVGYEYKSNKTNEIILAEIKENVLQKAEFATKKVSIGPNYTSSLADGVATDLSSGKLKNDSMLRERLLAGMKNNPNISSIVVAYSPAINAGKLYAPHFKRNGSEIVYSPLPNWILYNMPLMTFRIESNLYAYSLLKQAESLSNAWTS